MQKTGYAQLKKTQRISTFYCSSQSCASGTCGDDDYPRKIELNKTQSAAKKISPSLINSLRIGRSR